MVTKQQKYLLYLINCIMKGKSAGLPEEPFDWEGFVAYAKEQQFEHILYPLLKGNKPKMDNKIWHSLHQKYGRTVVRDSEQDMVLDEICTALSEAEIPHIPLKGSVIKKYYPLPDIRCSIDFDILVHEEDMPRATETLLKIGFKVEFTEVGLHDGLSRGKSHIELHKMLTVEEEPSYDFSCKVWENAYSEHGYTYSMTNEFFYVYMLMHLRKHLLISGGAGIKLILDFYVMRNKMNLDMDKLDDFCKSSRMECFNKTIVMLEQKWFEGIDSKDKNVLVTENIILNSGVYGDYRTYVDMVFAGGSNSNVVGNKFRNFMSYLFPGIGFLKDKYKILKKYPFFLPFVWIIRIFTVEKARRLAVINSLKSLNKNKTDILNEFKRDMLR